MHHCTICGNRFDPIVSQDVCEGCAHLDHYHQATLHAVLSIAQSLLTIASTLDDIQQTLSDPGLPGLQHVDSISP